MIKVSVIDKNQRNHLAQFETQSEADIWLSNHVAKNTFGLPERLVPQSDCTEEQLASALELIPEVLDEAGEILTPAMARLPCEYTIEIEDITAQVEQEKINQEARQFLSSTDWKILRHSDQLALGITTSLTEQEFQLLLSERQEARQRVV